MKNMPRLFIGIVMVIALIAFAEMSVSVFFATTFEKRHPGEDTPFPYIPPVNTHEQQK